MLETTPIPTMREFLEGKLTYVLPAPGGALKDGGIRTDQMGDAYMASLASKAKKRRGDGRSPVEYLQQHLEIVTRSRIFDAQTDALIITRIGVWIRELSN